MDPRDDQEELMHDIIRGANPYAAAPDAEDDVPDDDPNQYLNDSPDEGQGTGLMEEENVEEAEV